MRSIFHDILGPSLRSSALRREIHRQGVRSFSPFAAGAHFAGRLPITQFCLRRRPACSGLVLLGLLPHSEMCQHGGVFVYVLVALMFIGWFAGLAQGGAMLLGGTQKLLRKPVQPAEKGASWKDGTFYFAWKAFIVPAGLLALWIVTDNPWMALPVLLWLCKTNVFD